MTEAHTVMVTVDADAATLQTLLEHASIGLDRFPACPGFLDGALHVDESGTRLVQYLRWASEDAYHACVDDPAWEALPSAERFREAVASGLARMDVRVLRVLKRSG